MEDIFFDEETTKARFEDFFDVADKFCAIYNEGQSVPVEIDPSLLYLAVVAIYDDVARYKAYHLKNPVKQKANPVKRAAFAVKWLMHFSPLIFPQMGHLSGQHPPENGDPLANAMFALHFALMNLRAHTNVYFFLKREIHFELLYDLIYRGLTTDALILLFDIFSTLASEGKTESIIYF